MLSGYKSQLVRLICHPCASMCSYLGHYTIGDEVFFSSLHSDTLKVDSAIGFTTIVSARLFCDKRSSRIMVAKKEMGKSQDLWAQFSLLLCKLMQTFIIRFLCSFYFSCFIYLQNNWKESTAFTQNINFHVSFYAKWTCFSSIESHFYPWGVKQRFRHIFRTRIVCTWQVIEHDQIFIEESFFHSLFHLLPFAHNSCAKNIPKLYTFFTSHW